MADARLAERLHDLQQKYQATENPRYAWEAYRLTRGHSARIPSWVLRCFDIFASNVAIMATTKHKPTDRIASAVQAAFGFGPGGMRAAQDFGSQRRYSSKRKKNPFDDDTDSYYRELAAAVWMKAASGEYNQHGAWKKVEQEKGIGYHTVRRAWLKYRDVFDLSMTNARASWFLQKRQRRMH